MQVIKHKLANTISFLGNMSTQLGTCRGVRRRDLPGPTSQTSNVRDSTFSVASSKAFKNEIVRTFRYKAVSEPHAERTDGVLRGSRRKRQRKVQMYGVYDGGPTVDEPILET